MNLIESSGGMGGAGMGRARGRKVKEGHDGIIF